MEFETTLQQSLLTTYWNRLLSLRKRRVYQNAITLALVLFGPVLATTTFLALGGVERASISDTLRFIILADLVYVLIVAALVLQRVAQMVAARRAKSAGSQLHLRLVGVFALIALLPTVLVAIFATVTLNFGLEGWFSDRVRNVVGSSLTAAEAYESEHKENLIQDTKILADFLNDQKKRFPLITPAQLRDLLNRGQLQMQRELPEAFVISSTGELQARGERSYLFDYEQPGDEEIARALTGEIVVIEDLTNNEFRALANLPAFADRLLFVTRDVDGEILNLLDDTKATVGLYQQLESDRGKMLFEFGLIYLGFALIVILAAIWLGLWFAERLARPVGRLAAAAQRVGAGDFNVQVREESGDDEIAMLGRIFNRMTRQVKGQRDALLDSNAETERRRRLFDSVLTGVTAGVVGLNSDGNVELMNSAAVQMLACDAENAIGLPIGAIVPEFASVFHRLRDANNAVSQEEVQLNRNGKSEDLHVRIAERRSAAGELEGYVVTFDDVTDLVSAQRMAAWGDVARRIAHEIKNPLTPIKLSAGQLRRKFGPLVGKEREELERFADVIIRQTDDLGRIVDEFSKFARMPAPQRAILDIVEIIRDAVTLQQSAQPQVTFSLQAPEQPIQAFVDATMVSQAMTNLLKNACEAIETRQEKHLDGNVPPEIRVSVGANDQFIQITIQDNGIGLPLHRARLFEPYVTTRAKGTGLGLSIVKKIVEEHAGHLELVDAPKFGDAGYFGAEVQLTIPRQANNVPNITTITTKSGEQAA